MSIQEGRELIARPEEAAEAEYISTDQPAQQALEPARRAPPKCSGCGTIGHRINRCPD